MACEDYIVDVESELLLCRCGFPKSAHTGDAPYPSRRRTLAPTHQLRVLPLELPERDDAHKLVACDDYIVDLQSEQRLCRCGHPKSLHGVRHGASSTRNAVKSRRSLPASLAAEVAQGACQNFIIDLKSEFRHCQCGFPKSAHDNEAPLSRQDAAVIRDMAQSFIPKSCDVPISPRVACGSLKDNLALSTALETFQSYAEGVFPEKIQSGGVPGTFDVAFTPRHLNDHRDRSAGDEQSLAGESTEMLSRGDQEEDADTSEADKQDSIRFEIANMANDETCENDGQGVEPLMTEEQKDIDDGTVEASKVTYHRVKPIWTEAAQAAQDRAVAEKFAAEERAAAEKAKQVQAAAAARAKEEAEVERLRAQEQQALEEAGRKMKDEEAKKKFAAEQERINQRARNRMRKAQEREEEALRQAEARELAAREKAAQLAASRTVAVTCSCGSELMVTPDELKTLNRYVPGYADKSAEDLAKLLPDLKMGAWIQGTKHLFATQDSKPTAGKPPVDCSRNRSK